MKNYNGTLKHNQKCKDLPSIRAESLLDLAELSLDRKDLYRARSSCSTSSSSSTKHNINRSGRKPEEKRGERHRRHEGLYVESRAVSPVRSTDNSFRNEKRDVNRTRRGKAGNGGYEYWRAEANNPQHQSVENVKRRQKTRHLHRYETPLNEDEQQKISNDHSVQQRFPLSSEICKHCRYCQDSPDENNKNLQSSTALSRTQRRERRDKRNKFLSNYLILEQRLEEQRRQKEHTGNGGFSRRRRDRVTDVDEDEKLAFASDYEPFDTTFTCCVHSSPCELAKNLRTTDAIAYKTSKSRNMDEDYEDIKDLEVETPHHDIKKISVPSNMRFEATSSRANRKKNISSSQAKLVDYKNSASDQFGSNIGFDESETRCQHENIDGYEIIPQHDAEGVLRNFLSDASMSDQSTRRPYYSVDNAMTKNFDDTFFYLGEMSRIQAEQNCRMLSSFRLYHRYPSSQTKNCEHHLPPVLPLFIVYRTSRGDYCRRISDGASVIRQVKVDIPQEPYFPSLSALISYYTTYVIVREPDGQPDCFPWWVTKNDYLKRSAIYEEAMSTQRGA